MKKEGIDAFSLSNIASNRSRGLPFGEFLNVFDRKSGGGDLFDRHNVRFDQLLSNLLSCLFQILS